MDNDIKGNKHCCSNCETKFYDFNKVKAVCPKCGAEITKVETTINNITSEKKDKDDIEVRDMLEEDLDVIEENDDKDDDHIINVE